MVSCTDSLQLMRNKSLGRRRLRIRQGGGVLLHGTQSCRWPSWRALARDGVCMLCHTGNGSASSSCAATARSTLFQRRRHKRSEPWRTSPSTSMTMSTRCPCVSTRGSRQLELARPWPWAVPFHLLHVGGALLEDWESQDWRFLVLEQSHHHVT